MEIKWHSFLRKGGGWELNRMELQLDPCVVIVVGEWSEVEWVTT